MRKNHRVGFSRYVVPHPSYGWYVKTLALFALVGGLVLGGAAWFHQQRMLTAIGIEQLASHPELLKDQALNMLVFHLTLSGIAFSCFVLLVGAFYFHRIAGPVYRIKGHMLEVLEGKPVVALRLRNTDHLQDVAEVYNALLAKLEVIQEEPPAGP